MHLILQIDFTELHTRRVGSNKANLERTWKCTLAKEAVAFELDDVVIGTLNFARPAIVISRLF